VCVSLARSSGVGKGVPLLAKQSTIKGAKKKREYIAHCVVPDVTLARKTGHAC
jgi:hypothetical protein